LRPRAGESGGRGAVDGEGIGIACICRVVSFYINSAAVDYDSVIVTAISHRQRQIVHGRRAGDGVSGEVDGGTVVIPLKHHIAQILVAGIDGFGVAVIADTIKIHCAVVGESGRGSACHSDGLGGAIAGVEEFEGARCGSECAAI